MENAFKEELLLKEKLLKVGLGINSINDFIHTKEGLCQSRGKMSNISHI